jgi:putative restriction endonuclease
VETKRDLKKSQRSPWLCLPSEIHSPFNRGGEKNFEVLKSKQVKTDQNIPGHMMTLADRPIFKPQVQNFWPAQTNIEWHRKLVYLK